MIRTHFKIKLERKGKHIHATLFSGNEGQTLANNGTLAFEVGEWQLFGTLLALGYDSNSSIKRHCYYSVEGENEALNPEEET